MSRKLAGLYDPYLDTLGGGEKHILSILKVLEDENYSLNIFWDKNIQDEIKTKLDISFSYRIPFYPNIFSERTSIFKKIHNLGRFDYFFYVTDGSYFFSSAKNNFIFCMIPQRNLYPINLLNRLKTQNSTFIANSKYTQSWLSKWGIKTVVIYPYLSDKFLTTDIQILNKKKIILSVGRFFRHLHSKQQKKIIEVFKDLKKNHASFRDFKLVLVGGLKSEDLSYFNELKKIVGNNPSIVLKANIPFEELYKLYQEALFYWHFTGYGVDENKSPELVEHLGITPLEAMASGCLTFCYNAGGSKEIIENGRTGFLFNNKEDLLKKMLTILNDKKTQNLIRNKANLFVKKTFNYGVFKKRVKEVVLSKK